MICMTVALLFLLVSRSVTLIDESLYFLLFLVLNDNLLFYVWRANSDVYNLYNLYNQCVELCN